MFISMDGSSDWSWNSSESCFHFKLNGVEHTLKITASDSDASIGEVIEEFGAAFAFSTPDDTFLSFSFRAVH